LRFAYTTRGDGQFALDTMHLWNLHIGRAVAVGSRRLELAFDVFNIVNGGADQAWQPSAHQQFSPFYGQGAMRQFPRAAALTARFAF
jgi:hypothetical protein